MKLFHRGWKTNPLACRRDQNVGDCFVRASLLSLSQYCFSQTQKIFRPVLGKQIAVDDIWTKMSVSAVLNARLDWPGSSSLVPDVDSLCCQGVCTFHSHCLHQESLMPGLYLRGNENMYSPLSRRKDIGAKYYTWTAKHLFLLMQPSKYVSDSLYLFSSQPTVSCMVAR